MERLFRDRIPFSSSCLLVFLTASITWRYSLSEEAGPVGGWETDSCSFGGGDEKKRAS